LVTTVHGFSSERTRPVYRAYNDVCLLVAISAADRRPDLDYAATIHHGIDLREFTPAPHAATNLLFFGRIHPDKGAHIAIEVARRTGQRLILAGIVQDAEYFRTCREPFVDGQQIRFSRGSMPELIADGSRGLLVAADDLEAALAAVAQAQQLDGQAVRAHVERHFAAERTVDDYLLLYQRLLGRTAHDPSRPRRTRPAAGRCDACHERKAHVHQSTQDAETAIANVVGRAPAAERRTLSRRLAARKAMHTTRREHTPPRPRTSEF
jgi:hypothetical protein